MKTLAEIIANTITKEGGYVDNHTDHGGPTKYGITQATLSAWRCHPVSAQDVENLQMPEAEQIYQKKYYYDPQIDRLPVAVQSVMFDMAVNSGAQEAIKLAQRVFRQYGTPIIADGSIGPATILSAKTAVNNKGATFIVNAICDARIEFYRGIVLHDPKQTEFLNGWLTRANSFKIS